MVAVDVLKKNLYAKSKDVVKELDEMLSNVASDNHNVYERVIDKISKLIFSLELLKNVNKTKVSKEVLSCMVKESFNGDTIFQNTQ